MDSLGLRFFASNHTQQSHVYLGGFSPSLKHRATSKCHTSLRIMQQDLLDFARERRRPPSLEALARQKAAKQKQDKDDCARVGLRLPAVLPKRLGAGRPTHKQEQARTRQTEVLEVAPKPKWSHEVLAALLLQKAFNTARVLLGSHVACVMVRETASHRQLA